MSRFPEWRFNQAIQEIGLPVLVQPQEVGIVRDEQTRLSARESKLVRTGRGQEAGFR